MIPFKRKALQDVLEIVREVSFARIIIYCSYYFWGVKIAEGPVVSLKNVLVVILLLLSGIWITMINNIFDLESDRVNSPERYLASGRIQLKSYNRIQLFVLAILVSFLFYSIIKSSLDILLVMVPAVIYYLYSAPPFRLKMVPILNKLILAINPIALIVLGSSMIPLSLEFMLKLFVSFFLIAHYIDLKDEHGDREHGRLTLTTRLGGVRARLIVSIMSIIAHLLMLQYIVLIEAKLAFISIPVIFFILVKKPKENDTYLTLLNVISISILIIFSRPV